MPTTDNALYTWRGQPCDSDVKQIFLPVFYVFFCLFSCHSYFSFFPSYLCFIIVSMRIFLHPHFVIRIFPYAPASAIHRYPVHVLQIPHLPPYFIFFCLSVWECMITRFKKQKKMGIWRKGNNLFKTFVSAIRRNITSNQQLTCQLTCVIICYGNNSEFCKHAGANEL